MIEQDQSGCFCSVRKACACLCSLQSKQIRLPVSASMSPLDTYWEYAVDIKSYSPWIDVSQEGFSIIDSCIHRAEKNCGLAQQSVVAPCHSELFLAALSPQSAAANAIKVVVNLVKSLSPPHDDSLHAPRPSQPRTCPQPCFMTKLSVFLR